MGLWKSLNKSELVAALALVALGGCIVRYASAWGYMTKDGPGPGFFPLWSGIFIIVLAGWLVVAQLLRAYREGAAPGTDWKGSGRVLLGWAALMVSIALLKTAGFLASYLLLVVFLGVVIFRRRFVTALAVGLAASAGFWLVFVELLNVQLPAGPWGF
jgi:putative tricarboxylic transport membrane protein